MRQDISFTGEEIAELESAGIDAKNLTDSTVQYLHNTHQARQPIEIKVLEKILPKIYNESSPLSLSISKAIAKELSINEKITIFASVPNHLWYLSALGCTYAANILIKMRPLEEKQERKNTFSFTINSNRHRTLFAGRAVTVSRSGLIIVGLLQMIDNPFHESAHLRTMLRLMSEFPTTLKEKAFAVSDGHWQFSYDDALSSYEEKIKAIQNKSDDDAKKIKGFTPLEILPWVRTFNSDEIYNRHLQHITNWLVAFGAIIPNDLIRNIRLSQEIKHIPSISYELESGHLIHSPSAALPGENIELALFYRFYFDQAHGKNTLSNTLAKSPIFGLTTIFPEIIIQIILQYLYPLELKLPSVESHFSSESQRKIRSAIAPYFEPAIVEHLITGAYFKGLYYSKPPFQQSFFEPLQPSGFCFIEALKQWLLDFSSNKDWPFQKQNLAEFLCGPRYHQNPGMDITYSADNFFNTPGTSEKIKKGLYNIKAQILESEYNKFDKNTLVQTFMDFINQHQKWKRLIIESKLPDDDWGDFTFTS